MTAYRAMLERTSTKTAPWHIVPADHKWVRDAVVTEVLTQTLEGLGLQWPELRARAQGARRRLSGAPENDAGAGLSPGPLRPSRLWADERVSARRRNYLWKCPCLRPTP